MHAWSWSRSRLPSDSSTDTAARLRNITVCVDHPLDNITAPVSESGKHRVWGSKGCLGLHVLRQFINSLVPEGPYINILIDCALADC